MVTTNKKTQLSTRVFQQLHCALGVRSVPGESAAIV
jgi:hypothetical protein